jgi:DNA polymerase-4
MGETEAALALATCEFQRLAVKTRREAGLFKYFSFAARNNFFSDIELRFIFTYHEILMRPLPLFEEGASPTCEWLFLDLNSYFASIEQELRPELRGRPIGIVPALVENTCCIAASYEAKVYGVKTGTGTAEAKILCPHIQLVESRPKLYVQYHLRILEAVGRCIPIAHVMSIDEMACRLIGRECFLPNANAIAQEIKKSLRAVGETLRCSIGLAPNRYLGKVAADVCKPDGLFSLLKSDLPQALYCLELSDLVGVGNQMEARLLKHGITTVAHLCSLTPEQMRRIWNSVMGERLWHWLRGADFHDPKPPRKSIGKQHVLAPELRTRELAFRVAQKLLHGAAAKLRWLNLWAGGIGTRVSFLKKQPASVGMENGQPHWEAGLRIHECRDTPTLQAHLGSLWKYCPPGNPLSVGVVLFNLVPDELHTLSLFETDDKKYKMSLAMDRLNQKFGRNTVYLGSVHNIKSAAPTRVAFSNTGIPELWEFE